MTLMTQDLSLTLTREIAAPPERVYAAWLSAETLVRFMQNCQGLRVPHAQTDPVVGGAFQIVMNNGKDDILHTGTYLELVPHSRIVFTWVSPYSTAEGSTVTIDLAPHGAATLLTLTHRRFANEGSRDGHRAGWSTMLDGLAATAL